MDPEANLDEQLNIANTLLDERQVEQMDSGDLLQKAQRLAQLVEAMDGWLRNSGFLPREWSRK